MVSFDVDVEETTWVLDSCLTCGEPTDDCRDDIGDVMRVSVE